jgi:PAS domain S-box-containing protein
VPPSRFAPEINRLRAILRGHRGPDLITVISQEVEQLPVAALVADNSQRYVAANAAARELTGYTESELAALTVTDLTPVPRSADGQQLWEEFIGKGGQYGAYDLQTKRGSAKHVRYWAFASVAPGLHVSLLVPVDADGGAAI